MKPYDEITKRFWSIANNIPFYTRGFPLTSEYPSIYKLSTQSLQLYYSGSIDLCRIPKP